MTWKGATLGTNSGTLKLVCVPLDTNVVALRESEFEDLDKDLSCGKLRQN